MAWNRLEPILKYLMRILRRKFEIKVLYLSLLGRLSSKRSVVVVKYKFAQLKDYIYNYQGYLCKQ